MSARIYLDHNATTPLRPEARDAIDHALDMAGNASSVHAEGRGVRALVERAREQVARLVCADPKSVIFTSGGTEANVTALSPRNVNPDTPEKVVCFMTGIEHPSVATGGRFPAEAIRTVPVTSDGVIDVALLDREINAHVEQAGAGTFMVTLMRANNETGALQPVSQVAQLVREHGGFLHCDAIQAAGKEPVDIGELGAHITTISAHKLGGPQGVGALVLGEGMSSLPHPLISGGGQELRARSGTENVSGIAGFGAAAESAQRDLDRTSELARLRDRLEAGIAAHAPDAVFYSQAVERLPNTSNFAVPGLKAETLVIALDLAGIAVSAGSACSSGKVDHSPVLSAMRADPDVASGAIRVSLGWNSRAEDVDRFIAAWTQIYDQHTKERTAA